MIPNSSVTPTLQIGLDTSTVWDATQKHVTVDVNDDITNHLLNPLLDSGGTVQASVYHDGVRNRLRSQR